MQSAPSSSLWWTWAVRSRTHTVFARLTFSRQLQSKENEWLFQKVILYQTSITWKHLERSKGCREVTSLHKINVSWQNTGNQTGKCKLLINFWESMNLRVIKIQSTKESSPAGPHLASKTPKKSLSSAQVMGERKQQTSLDPNSSQCQRTLQDSPAQAGSPGKCVHRTGDDKISPHCPKMFSRNQDTALLHLCVSCICVSVCAKCTCEYVWMTVYDCGGGMWVWVWMWVCKCVWEYVCMYDSLC